MVRNHFVGMLGMSALLLGGTVLATTAKQASPLAAYRGKKATAVVFIGVACPIANRHAPELAALARTAKAHGGQLVLVYSNPGDQKEARAHAKKYGLGDAVIVCDGDQALKTALGASVTPHAFVLDTRGKVLYNGRISDDGQGQAKQIGRASCRERVYLAV